jgi:hypothetical protein
LKAVLEVKNNSLELQIYPFEACPSVGPARESIQDLEPEQAQQWFPRLRTARDVKGFAWIELTGVLVIEPLLSISS